MSKNAKQKPHNKPSAKALRQMRAVRARWHFSTFTHVVAVILTLALALALTLVIVINDMLNGPSPTASDLLITTLNETSALKFVPDIFMREEYVKAALDRNRVVALGEPTDVSLITVKAHTAPDDSAPQGEEEQPIQIYPVRGATYKGYMMIVLDPSRVIVGVCRSPFSRDENPVGMLTGDIIEKYGGVAGINAGAFEDTGGGGRGGRPMGMVYSEGERLNSAPTGKYFDDSVLSNYATIAGFDNNDILHVGMISNAEAEEIGIRDAVAFGPVLVANGIPSDVTGFGSGLNPRSAIGQRADGAVLMLTIDGRQINALGASYDDLIQIMLDYGAVNACNMDGGSSAAMFLNGEQINDGLMVSGSRALPTAWVVK